MKRNNIQSRSKGFFVFFLFIYFESPAFKILFYLFSSESELPRANFKGLFFKLNFSFYKYLRF